MVSFTFGLLFFKDVYKNYNSKYPLGYNATKAASNRSEYPNCIKDRTAKDIVKDRFMPGKTKIPSNIDYIIIGSGISGLTAASCLSRVGHKCLVLEQHDRLGGCMHQYSRAFGFDVGIHYVGRAKKYERQLKCITDPESPQYPIKFAKMGNKNNNYVYDRYLIGTGKNQVIYDAKGDRKQLDGLKESKWFKNDAEQLELIEKLKQRVQQGKITFSLAVLARLMPEWMGKIVWNITKWWFGCVWNKTILQVLNEMGLTDDNKKNRLLKTLFLANIGNLGGFTNNGSFAVFCAMFEHYREGGNYMVGGPQQITRAIMPVIEKSGGRCLAKLSYLVCLFVYFLFFFCLCLIILAQSCV